MNIDRKLQLDVLQFCRDAYPGRAADAELPCHPDLQANLVYLSEHELIYGTLVNGNVELRNPGITAKGLDFLEDDGGISAILRTITVKMDREDLRILIAARVEASDLPSEEKTTLSRAMRSLPEHVLRNQGTDNIRVEMHANDWPSALGW